MTRDSRLFDNVAQGERSSERKSDTRNNYMARFVIGGFDRRLTIDYSRGAEVCADWRAEKETAMRPYRFGLYVAIMAAMIRAQGFAGEASGDSARDEAVLKTREGPLATITRELYMPSPRAGQSYVIGNQYVGREGAERLQVRTLQVHDDVYQDATFRRSPDNGRTWSDFERDPERDILVKDGYARNHYVFPGCYDPAAGRIVRMTLLRTHKGDPRVSGLSTYWDHTLWQTSVDNGRTWDMARLLKYEEGAEYDAEEFGNPEFLTRNGSYSGYNVIPLQEGGIATACSLTTERVNEDGVKES